MTVAKDVLFIDARHGSDFTLDAVWAGLVDRFGPHRVFDYGPCHEKHQSGVPQDTGNSELDYGAERRSLCYTPDQNRALLRQLDVRQINDRLREGKFGWIFIDERVESYQLYLQTAARFFSVPVVVVAGHDRFWNWGLGALQQMYGKNLLATFADNWRPEYEDFRSLFPMSYATNFDHLWDVGERGKFLQNKLYDICFMGYNSHPDRAEIVTHLQRKYSESKNCLFVETQSNTVRNFVPKRQYFERIARSRVCINLRGAAECGKALRFYEIPYVGSFMLSQKFGGKQVRPYLDGTHCKYFEGIGELDETIQWALDNSDEREKIAAAGHAHAIENHTASARVNYMFDCLGAL